MQKKLYLLISLTFLFFSQYGYSQATCATAVAVTVGTQQCGSSLGQPGDFPAGSTAPTNPCNSLYNDDEYWFSIVGDGTNSIQVDLSGITETYAGVFVLDDCPVNTPNCVASATNGNATTDLSAVTTAALANGTTYYIVVASWGAPDFTDFCMDVTLVPPPTAPANDDCAAPVMLPVNADLTCAMVVSGTTLLATETLPGCTGTANDDVWFSFVATNASHAFEVLNVTAVSGTSTDMSHEVFSGTCGALTSLGCSDPNTSTISGLTPGTTYFVRVHSWLSSSSQTFDICVGTNPPPPANDSCAIAEVLPVQADSCMTWTVGDNTSAGSSSVPDPSCGSYSGGDVWYEVTVPASGNVIFDVQNVSWTSAAASLYSGTCAAAVEEDCTELSTGWPFVFSGLAPGTYYLRVWDYSNNQTGTFELCAYTTACSITELAAGTQTACDPVTNTYTQEIIVTYTDEPGTGTLDVNGQSFAITGSPQTVVLTGLISDGAAVDANAVFSASNTCLLDSLDLFTAPANCLPPAPNDDCADAVMVPVNTIPDTCAVVTAGSTEIATESLPGCVGTANDDVWFSFVATNTSHTFDLLNVTATTGTSTDLVHEIFSGTCGALTSIDCSDPNSSQIDTLVVGNTYYVRVYSYFTSSSQSFDLCIGLPPLPPANDECMMAETLPVQTDSCSTFIMGDNTGATGDTIADPSCGSYGGGDVWYEVTVPASGNVIFDVQNVSWTSAAASLYSGTCAAPVEEDCTELSSGWPFVFSGLAPGTYYLRVWDYLNNQTGTFELCAYTTACSITELAAGAFVACDSVNNTFSQEVIVTYTDEPGTGTLDVNGQSFPITGSPQTVVLTGLTPGSVDVSAEFSDQTTCTLDSLGLIAGPGSCIEPVANDSCQLAEPLAVQADSCVTWTLGNNTGATDSGAGAPSCGSYNGGDLWYEVMVPASGVVTFDVDSVTWSSAAASLYSGTCGTLVEEDCTQFTTGWPFQFDGLTPGTYYLRVWDFGNNDAGSFQICAYEPAPCAIAEISLGAQTVCDTLNGTYTQEVIVVYSGASSGTLDVNGQTTTITTSPQTVTLTLSADGMPVTVVATISGDNSCTFTSTDLFTAPAGCYDFPSLSCDAYSSSPGAVIDDNNDPSDVIMVTGTGMALTDLNVVLKIDHTYLADLDITLTSPAGTVVNLTFDNCVGDENMDVEFDDEAAGPIVCATPTLGVFTPDGNLSDFDGELFDGAWTLDVVDDAGGDDGVLIQWCLLPELGTPPCAIFTFTDTDEVSCQGTSDGAATATPSYGTMPYTYQWDAAAGSQTTATAVNLAVGQYLVTVTDAEGCTDVAGVIIEEAPCDFCELAEDNNTDICAVITADPTDPLANLDCDGDGVTNGDECNDDTDPSDECDFEETSITEPVTNVCPPICPDLTVVTTLIPGNIAGPSAIAIDIDVVELAGADADGVVPITVRMPSDPRLTFNWNAGLNPNWMYLGDNGITHSWRFIGNPGSGILAGTTETILIDDGMYDPQGTSGSTTITATVVPFSGGECTLTNNSDPETLVYFK